MSRRRARLERALCEAAVIAAELAVLQSSRVLEVHAYLAEWMAPTSTPAWALAIVLRLEAAELRRRHEQLRPPFRPYGP